MTDATPPIDTSPNGPTPEDPAVELSQSPDDFYTDEGEKDAD
jgi:hypothetical protein